MTFLLDGNVLVALVASDHVHHGVAEDWLAASSEPFATCANTQGTLLRFLIRSGSSARSAREVLHKVAASPRHELWADALSYLDVRLDGVVGHRQVTDAYLAGLARTGEGRPATLDRGLAATHPDVAVLLSGRQ